MNFFKKYLYVLMSLVFVSFFALGASAQIYGNVNVTAAVPTAVSANATATVNVSGVGSPLTRAQLRAEATSTRMANIQARDSAMMQKGHSSADTAITARINSLNDLIAKINGIKNVSASDKASIVLTTQNEISSMTALQAKIDADTSTTTLRADLKSITADYRVYALIEPQLEILTAADRINQIISLMTVVQTKLQVRISALQSAGINTSSLTSTLADITAKISDAQTQSSSAVSATATLTPDQGDATIAASNETALKSARADIKAGNADLQAANKDLSSVVISIKSLTPKGEVSATTTVSATTSASY